MRKSAIPTVALAKADDAMAAAWAAVRGALPREGGCLSRHSERSTGDRLGAVRSDAEAKFCRGSPKNLAS